MGAGEEGPAVGAGPRWSGNSHQEEKHEAWPSHGAKKCVAERRAGAQSSAPGAGIDGRTAGTRSTEASRTTASRGEALIRSCRGLRQSPAERRGGCAPTGRWSRWRAGWGWRPGADPGSRGSAPPPPSVGRRGHQWRRRGDLVVVLAAGPREGGGWGHLGDACRATPR
jgi:hypothetical protein